MNKIKTKILTACLIVVAVLPLSACGGKKNALDIIRESGVLRVAIIETGEPFARVTDGQPEGIEPQLVQQTAEALGVNAEYTVMDREAALDAVVSGEADLAMGGLSEQSGSSRGLLASLSYGKRFLYFVTNADVYVNSASDFDAQTIGICGGINPETVETPTLSGNVQTLSFPDVSRAEESLTEGEIMGFFCYEDEAEKFLDDDSRLVQSLPFLVWEEYCAQALPENAELISGFNVLIERQLEAGGDQ